MLDETILPHGVPFSRLSARYGVSLEDGLSAEEAERRFKVHGPNVLEGDSGVSRIRVFVAQIANAMTFVMIIALAISLVIKSWIEAGVIAGVIVVNVVVGYFQQSSAEATMDSLRSLASPRARALRDGRIDTIDAASLVPGDIVELKSGDVVPADVRLLETHSFETDEALLTGESQPVLKEYRSNFSHAAAVPVGERVNMAFAGTVVSKGRARALVVGIGMATEIGAIARSVRRQHWWAIPGESSAVMTARLLGRASLAALGRFLGLNVGTLLQRQLNQLALALFGLAVVLAIVVEAVNSFSGQRTVVIYAVTVGLCMIPASLVVVLTITFAFGARRMVARNVIARRLDSLEALGSVQTICTDKTGTLTQGRMVVRQAWVPRVGTWTVDDVRDPYDPADGVVGFEPTCHNGQTPSLSDALADLLECGTFCNTATLRRSKKEEKWLATGSPTEVAIQAFVNRFDNERHSQRLASKLLLELPFTSDLKRVTYVYRSSSSSAGPTAFCAGAPESVLDIASVGKEVADAVARSADALSAEGLRVVAVAKRDLTKEAWTAARGERENIEEAMTVTGLFGIYDPPRLECRAAVQRCEKAGISVTMLTGDAPGTASAIARQVGILCKDALGSAVAHAADIDRLSNEEMDRFEIPKVIGRCAPRTKMRIIEALHRRGRIVAMTGDGINDVPSLKEADVGIGMGSGSDAAKAAASIVLADDNFASIVAAVEEGRRSAANIQKFVLHLLAFNVTQVILLVAALGFKDGGGKGVSVFPLAPVPVLWVIVVTTGPPAMGLGMEQAAPDIMWRPPRDPRRGIFDNEMLVDVAVYGVLGGVVCLSTFAAVIWGFSSRRLDGGDRLGSGGSCNQGRDGCEIVFRARAACFATICWLALILAWELCDLRRSLFRMHPESRTPATQWMRDVWSNQLLFWSVVIGFAVVFPLIYVPVLNDRVFLHAPISWEWLVCLVASAFFLLAVESWKLFKRRLSKRSLRRAEKAVP